MSTQLKASVGVTFIVLAIVLLVLATTLPLDWIFRVSYCLLAFSLWIKGMTLVRHACFGPDIEIQVTKVDWSEVPYGDKSQTPNRRD